MDPISIAMLAAKFAPSIIGMFAGGDAEDKAEKVLGIAKAITGVEDSKRAIEALATDPVLALEFERSAVQFQLELEREATKRLAIVNASKSEHWMQWSWRPFNGFLFGITVFSNYIVLPILNKTSVDNIEVALAAWSAVLGVSAWHRGTAKVKSLSLFKGDK